MTITVNPPTALLRILWAEDDPKDMAGTPEYLRYLGHEVVGTLDFESTAAALTSETFDLLVIDQQMPREGQKSDDAGAQLVTMLARGEFGPMNVDIQFVFVTASEDWVLDCDIDVESLAGYLGIEEKGDNLTGPLQAYLAEVSLRSGGPADTSQSVAPRPLVPSERSAAPTVSTLLAEEWHGVVIDVDEDAFLARLVAATGSLPDYEATLPRAAISERYQDCVVEGAAFTWSVEVEEDEEGQRLTVSRIRFQPTPVVSEDEIAVALRRARARRSADEFRST